MNAEKPAFAVYSVYLFNVTEFVNVFDKNICSCNKVLTMTHKKDIINPNGGIINEKINFDKYKS